MKSTALNPSLKKATHPPQHHWCTQQNTIPAKGRHYHCFNTLQQRKLPGQVVSAAPQHPLTVERVSVVQVNGIEEQVYDRCSVLNPSQVFTEWRKDDAESPTVGHGRCRLSSLLCHPSGQGISPPLCLIQPSEQWRHHSFPTWRERRRDRHRDDRDAQVFTDVPHADSLDGPWKVNPTFVYSVLYHTDN